MFAEKLDALMNIAEVSNSQLGRNVSINPSHIGRLRSGARSLPKKHDYLRAICRYLYEHIKKDYQINALQKLTGIGSSALASADSAAPYLERWLVDSEQKSTAAAERLISGFSRLPSKPVNLPEDDNASEVPRKIAPYLYGNAGKRKAVEQFFHMILREEKPQTLLLFSDENMAWLYEDAAFAARWAELFKKVIMRGNRVRIIHTISRDMNEMLEAIIKWIPLYMTGMIEPYCYPRLRDGIFQRTLFIAPDTAAIVSSSVQQDTDGMLNLFITDKPALDALKTEYEHYFSLCRPLMRIFTGKDTAAVQEIADDLADAEGNAYFCSAVPPLFSLPEKTVLELTEQTGNRKLPEQWKHSLAVFKKNIKKQRLTLVLSDPKCVLLSADMLCPVTEKPLSDSDLSYTKEQYATHIQHLKQMEKHYENLNIRFVREPLHNILLYVKENTGVIMVKPASPQISFVISERNMVSAFWDYLEFH